MPRWVAQLIFELYLPYQTPDNDHKERSMMLATWVTCEPDTVRCATTNDATTNEYYNKQFLLIKSGYYNERILQQTVFIHKIRVLQRTNTTTNSFY